MGDQIVSVDAADSHFHVSIATLKDVMERENLEYLQSLEGLEGIAGQLETSITNGLNADEAEDGFIQRKAAYVSFFSGGVTKNKNGQRRGTSWALPLTLNASTTAHP